MPWGIESRGVRSFHGFLGSHVKLIAVRSVLSDAQQKESPDVHEIIRFAAGATEVATATTICLDHGKAGSRRCLSCRRHLTDRDSRISPATGVDQRARKLLPRARVRNGGGSADFHLSDASEHSSARPGAVPNLRHGTGARGKRRGGP